MKYKDGSLDSPRADRSMGLTQHREGVTRVDGK
jgi:hypothetical protein